MICTIVPNNFFMSFEVVKCWLAIPKDFKFAYIQGSFIDENRNKALEMALNTKEDLLFIDSDITFTQDDILRMRNHLKTKEVVTGVYPIFIDGKAIPSVYKLEEGKYMPCEPQENVDACGAGFLGISHSLISRLPKNAFTRLTENGIIYGEDVSFCRRVQELGVSIYCDSRISVGQVRVENKRLD